MRDKNELMNLARDVFPEGANESLKNYLPREQYEAAVIEHLSDSSVAILTGRSGYGKSCIALHVLEEKDYKSARVICRDGEKYSELMEAMLKELRRITLPAAVYGLWLAFSYFKEFPGIGGALGADSTRTLQDKIINVAARKDVTLLFERIERLDEEVRNSIVHLLNDLSDGPIQKPKIICTSVAMLHSPKDSPQTDRFSNIAIKAFEPHEISKQVKSGLGLLKIEISESAIKEVVNVCCGSPLACSKLMYRVIRRAIVPIIENNEAYRIRSDEVCNAAMALGREHNFDLEVWRPSLACKDSDVYKILTAIIEEGHKGRLMDIQDRLDRKACGKIDAVGALRDLATKGQSDIVLEGDWYKFVNPFLYEKLRHELTVVV